MSHTIRKINLGNTALVESTIIDYVAGGEAYTLAELGLSGGINFIYFLEQATFDASLVNLIVPRLFNNKIILENAPAVEIPSTTGLNLTFVAIVHGT
jgi:hypothetical protein